MENAHLYPTTSYASASTAKWVGIIDVTFDTTLVNASFGDPSTNFNLVEGLNLSEGLNHVVLSFEDSNGNIKAVIPGTYSVSYQYEMEGKGFGWFGIEIIGNDNLERDSMVLNCYFFYSSVILNAPIAVILLRHT